MFKRKLAALEHHSPANFNINDEAEVRNLVIWLEDRKVRRYKIEDRQALRDPSTNLTEVLDKYFRDLGCPILDADLAAKLEWLLGFAVTLEYTDGVDKFKDVTAISEMNNGVPKVKSVNPLDNLDFNSPDFKKGILALAKVVNVTPHPDHLITLEAVCKVVKERLSEEALANPNNVIVKGKPYPFQEADLGFDLGDNVLNQAAKILRLLYIHDLRDLQTHINEIIVAVQAITANPKTDTKLGKVGY